MLRPTLILPLLVLVLSPPAFGAEPADVAAIEACIAKAGDMPQRSCIGQISDACQQTPEGSTTSGTDDCLSREGDAWDEILNENYAAETTVAKALDAERKADGDTNASAAADLLKAQRAWIAYRDAECDRRFEVDKDGTIRTATSLSCVLDLTALRALDLQQADR